MDNRSSWSVFRMLFILIIALWYLFGFPIAAQVFTVAAATFFATGRRYRWFYILYKTLPRDVQAAYRFLRINLQLRDWNKRNMSVTRLFTEEVSPKRMAKVAYHFEGRSWTYSQVEAYSNRVGNYFMSLKKADGTPLLQREDSVGLVMENCPEYVCIWLGLAKVGFVTALINSNLRREPLSHSIQAANCKVLICGASLSAAVAEVYESIDGIPLFQLGKSDGESPECLSRHGVIFLGDVLPQASSELPIELIRKTGPRDKLMYIYTSGTTGLPKAAVITNLRFMFMTVSIHLMLGIKDDDVVYDPLPLYHTAGGIIGAGQAIICGNTVALRKKFSASNFWKDCVTYKCTVAQYIGEICRYLLSVPEMPEERDHKVRVMFGNGLRPQIWKTFVERFRIKQIGELYGATEGNSNIINIDGTIGAVGFVPRYAGKVYPMALIRVDEETGEPLRGKDGLCIRCEPGEPGISVAKINNKNAISSFHGYADKKASEKKVIHDVFTKGDSAFNSGDILVMDEFGYFYFKDRTGDTFRWKGENVATSEVEAVISNIVGLKDATVYGVEVPETEGRAGMAAIVDEDGSLDLVKLSEGMKKSLPGYARPLFLRVLKELPMTGTYKLKKKDLQSDGFSPKLIKDKLYISVKEKFVPLTEEIYADVLNGKVKL
ncbi:long-chain fatty acid transport protein 1 [Ischnura elegans]|uniref:long-chain fatty acid transport protein 1 n=1 Tax=Ischnura elegans TaxID=197161 RepID=UPI001ED8B97D|nr:long-chain fatty acid transport protein 1 [Ischnura elegans]